MVQFDLPNKCYITAPGFVCAHCFSHSLVLGQIEVQYLCYHFVKACLLCIYSAMLASTDLITHSRHGQEWMKVSKIHFSPHDSPLAAKFQVLRLSEEKPFLVTSRGSSAIPHNHNNNLFH